MSETSTEQQSHKFQIWRWSILGALLGALPITTVAFLLDTTKVASKVFVITFTVAIPLAYLVGLIYERQRRLGRVSSLLQRLQIVMAGGLIAAVPIFLVALIAVVVDYSNNAEIAIAITLMLGLPLLISGTLATSVLLCCEKWV